MCVRNTYLEEVHSGQSPVSKTGDFSDVFVIDAEGSRIAWTEVSKISDDEMRRFLKQVVNRLYTWLLKTEDLGFHTRLRRWVQATEGWDTPELDDVLMRIIAQDS